MVGARTAVLVVPPTIYLLSNFHRVAPAVVAADLMKAFSITASSLGTLAAIYPYVFVVMALVAGSLVETLGPRLTLTSGTAAMAVGTVLFGLAPVFGVAAVGRLLIGLGASVILIAWLSLAAAWYEPQRFATISGWTQTVGNLGALTASSPLALAVEAIGWRSTFVVVGAVTFLPALAARHRGRVRLRHVDLAARPLGSPVPHADLRARARGGGEHPGLAGDRHRRGLAADRIALRPPARTPEAPARRLDGTLRGLLDRARRHR